MAIFVFFCCFLLFFCLFFRLSQIFFIFFLSNFQRFNLFLKIFYEKKVSYSKKFISFAGESSRDRTLHTKPVQKN